MPPSGTEVAEQASICTELSPGRAESPARGPHGRAEDTAKPLAQAPHSWTPIQSPTAAEGFTTSPQALCAFTFHVAVCDAFQIFQETPSYLVQVVLICWGGRQWIPKFHHYYLTGLAS